MARLLGETNAMAATFSPEKFVVNACAIVDLLKLTFEVMIRVRVDFVNTLVSIICFGSTELCHLHENDLVSDRMIFCF